MPTITERLIARVDMKTRGFMAGAGAIMSITGKLTRHWKLMGLAGAASFAGMIKLASDFEKQLAEIHTLLSVDTKTIKKYGVEVMDLSDKLGRSTKEVNSALYQAISAGVSFGDSLAFVEKATDLANAGVTDLLTSVDILTGVMNAYGKSAEEAHWASNILFKTIREGKVRLGELGYHMGKVLTIAAQAGMEFEELAAAAAVLTKRQLPLRQAMTGVRSILTQIMSATPELRMTFAKLGIDFSVAGLRGIGFVGIMKQIHNNIGDNVELLNKLLPNVEALPAVMALAGDANREYVETLAYMKDGHDEVVRGSKIMQNTFAFQWDKFTSRLSNVGKAIAGTFLPTLNMMVEDLGKAASSIRKWLQKEGVFDWMENFFVTGYKEISAGIKNFAADVVESMAVIVESSGEMLGYLNKIPGSIEFLWGKATSGLRAKMNEAEQAISKTEWSLRQLKKEQKWLWEGELATEGMKNRFRELSDEIKNSEQELRKLKFQLQSLKTEDALTDLGMHKFLNREEAIAKRIKALATDLRTDLNKEQLTADRDEADRIKARDRLNELWMQNMMKRLETSEAHKKRMAKERGRRSDEEENRLSAIRVKTLADESRHIEATTAFFENELEKRTDKYLEEYQQRLSIAEQYARWEQSLEQLKSRRIESHEERMFRLKTQHLTDRGKLVQTRFMAEKRMSQALQAEEEGRYEEGRRLTQKAIDYYESIATSVKGPDRQEAIRRIEESEAAFMRMAEKEKGAVQDAAVANQQRLEQLKQKIDEIQQLALQKTQVKVETKDAIEKLAQLKAQLDGLADRILRISARVDIKTIERKATGGWVGSQVNGRPAGRLSMGTDSVLCGLTPGEYVTPVRQAKQAQVLLESIRRGQLTDSGARMGILPRLQAGGNVPEGRAFAGNVNVYFPQARITTSVMRNVVIPEIRKAAARGWG